MLSWLLPFLVFLYFLYHFALKRRSLPPGPMPWPLVGNLLHLDRCEPNKTLATWAQEYGPIYTAWFGSIPAIIVTDYELLKEAFVKQGDNYANRPDNYVFDFFTGGKNGIINSSGEKWKEQRRFSLHTLRDFGFGRTLMEDKIGLEVDKLLAWMEEDMEGRKEHVFCLDKNLDYCVGNIISAVVLGYTFERGDNDFDELKRILDENLRLLSSVKVFLLISYPWLRFLPLFGRFGLDELRVNRDRVIGKMKDELEKHKKRLSDSEAAEDFVSVYLKEMEKRRSSGENMGYFDDEQLVMTITDLWIAGMETTVTTLKWAVLFMMLHPDVQEKTRQEILTVVGPSRRPGWADRNAMPYTTAVIHEIQRLGSIIPINLQHTVHENVKLGGYLIQKGMVVIPQVSALMLDPQYFPEPEEFRPERFLEEDGKSLKKTEHLMPFSIGKRICLGESLARMELFLIFSSLLQRYSFAVPKGHVIKTRPRAGITRSPQEYEALLKVV